MLASIRQSDSTKVHALHVDKRDGPFACPMCGHETILRKGKVKTAHFAHKPPILCEFGRGESEDHRRCKQTIYSELCKLGNLHCELEKGLGKVRPDVYIESGLTGNKYAIEAQISSLTMDKIISRTQEYNRLGIYVLWLAQYNRKLQEARYSPRAWERWLHAVYFGRVYYWTEGLSIIPVHFGEYQQYIDIKTWYSQGGEGRYGGGYFKRYKRYRTPTPGKTLLFPEAFKPDERRESNSGGILVPKCKIVLDRLTRWWSSDDPLCTW